MRIPYASTPKGYEQPLYKVVERAAANSGRTKYEIAIVMSHFLEALVDEVTKGRAVSIPGFGIFAPIVTHSHFRRGTPALRDKPRPKFYPSRAFTQQVLWGSPPAPLAERQFQKFRENHHPSSRPERIGSRTTFAMRGWRDRIAAQLAQENFTA